MATDLPSFNPNTGSGNDTPAAGGGSIGDTQAFKPFQQFGLGTYFPVVMSYAGSRGPIRPVPRAAAMDPDLRGEFNAILPQQVDSIQALQGLYGMDPGSLQNLQGLLNAAGYGKFRPTGYVDEDTISAFNSVLRDAAAYQQNNPDSQMTPEQLLLLRAKWAKDHGLLGHGGAGGAGGGGPITTQTQSSVSYLDPLAARKLAHDAFSSELGRAPSKKESAAFMAALHAYESSHPSTSTTTGIGTGHLSTTTRQGADEAAFADAYGTSSQGLANETGAQHEIGFVNVLSKMMGGG